MKKFLLFFVAILAVATGAYAGEVGLPHNWGWDFQKQTTQLGDRIYDFHIFINIVIAIITLVVLGLIGYIIFRFSAKRNPVPSKTTHNTLLEVIWTVIPILVVVMIIIPSMKLLYYVDRTDKADITLKVTGYQWYWGYELPDQKVAEFESRLIPTDKLPEGGLKLLEVDEPLVLPVGKTVRVLVTADPLGVIHAWGLNSLAFKRDAMPGRVNEGWIRIEKPGVYYGQCYELCGVDHAYMPIKVIGVTEEEFNKWVVSKGGSVPNAEAIDATEATPSKGKADAATIPAPEKK